MGWLREEDDKMLEKLTALRDALARHCRRDPRLMLAAPTHTQNPAMLPAVWLRLSEELWLGDD